MNNEKKKIIIIGAGISGLTAGIYALDNGYDVTIYEKHNIAGGQCTGWVRDNMYIDGCAHWIVGTSPSSPFNKIWKHIGAFNKNTKVYDTEYFNKFDIDGKIITFYADLDKLKEEFMSIAPEDKKMINSFIRSIKAYRSIKIPLKKPVDQMNLFELISYGFPMLKLLPHLLKYMHVSMADFALKFKSPYLRKLFQRVIESEYNVHSLLYIMQTLSKNDAGMVEGGSLLLAQNVKNSFVAKGGKVLVDNEVDYIIIDNHKATGVVLKNGRKDYCDYVISSCDANHTINKLLLGKYKDKYYENRFDNIKDNPLQQCFQVAFKVKKNMDEYPKMMNININPIFVNGYKIDNISIRNHAFDKKLYKKNVTLTLLIKVDNSVYDYLKSLNENAYENEKNRIGNLLKEEVAKYYNINENDISLIDVTTPLTYERYTNAYRGSYMSFITTHKVKGLMRKGLIKGLNNFALAGQWIMAPGGLPIALFTGKHSVYRICKMDKKKFIDLA